MFNQIISNGLLLKHYTLSVCGIAVVQLSDGATLSSSDLEYRPTLFLPNIIEQIMNLVSKMTTRDVLGAAIYWCRTNLKNEHAHLW